VSAISTAFQLRGAWPLTLRRCSRARIILADEAAAHVDDETENKISKAFLRAAAQGRTVLSVAHRCASPIFFNADTNQLLPADRNQ
jgi:ABC-type bacteriocin/lantibiotic exporter with double-glycine peptidase domain